jgi:hypothetical protein
MSNVKLRVEKMEQRLGANLAPGAIDWPALVAYVAKCGKRLIRVDLDG